MRSLFALLIVAGSLWFGCGDNPSAADEKTGNGRPPPGVHKFTVLMKDFRFEPKDLTVAKGDTVVWLNQGNVQHTTTSGQGCTADNNWNSGLLSPGQGFAYVFTSSGQFAYYCIPHCLSGMTGSVTVNP